MVDSLIRGVCIRCACRPLHVQVCDMLVLANNQSSAKTIARVKSQAQ